MESIVETPTRDEAYDGLTTGLQGEQDGLLMGSRLGDTKYYQSIGDLAIMRRWFASLCHIINHAKINDLITSRNRD